MAENGLTQVPRIQRRHQINQSWGFHQGDVRSAVRQVFSEGEQYIMFKTVANEEAAELLEEYVAVRQDWDQPWEIERKDSIKRRVFRQKDRDAKNLYFNTQLMSSYQRVIDKQAQAILGEHNMARFPMVRTDGVHSLERDPNAIFWPEIYVVTAGRKNDLTGIIEGLSTEQGFTKVAEDQAPQNYQLAEAQILYEKGVSPIVMLEDELHLTADELVTYADFFSQMRETYRWTGPVIDAD